MDAKREFDSMDEVPPIPRLCRHLSERSPQPTVAVDGTTHVVHYVNPAFARLVGKEAKSLIGRPFAEAVPEGADNGCLAMLDRVFSSGIAENLPEQEHRHSEPGSVNWSYAMWAILGADEHPVGVMIQVTDATETALFRRQLVAMNESLLISATKQHELTEVAESLITEQKRAEKALRASEERFRAVVESDIIAIAFWTMEGQLIDGNDAFLRIIGYTRADMVAGKVSWRELTPAEFTALDDRAVAAIKRDGRCVPYDKEFLRKDGSRVPVRLGAAWLPGQGIGVAYFHDITEQKNAEHNLRRQSDILRSTLDSIGDGVAAADEHGKLLFFNPAGERILRFGVSETRPEKWSEVYSVYQPDGQTLFPFEKLPLVQAAIHGESIDQVEMFINHDRVPEGLWISVTARPIYDESAQLRGGVAVFRDVTNQKKLEARLRQDALLLANVRDAVIVTDSGGMVTYWNEAATRLFGLSAEEAIGQSLRKEFPWTESARQDEFAERISRDGECMDEWQAQRKDGSPVWIHSRVTRITDATGQLAGWMGICHDITARKASEEALRMRDRAIQAVRQGITITDPRLDDNPIIYASPGFELITGYPAAEAVGRNCRFLQGLNTDPAAVAEIRDSIRNGRSCTVELLNYRKDGTPFWNEMSISPVTDHEDQLTHFVGVQTNVTKRRSLEEQFRQSQKMEAVGRLAGGVAHDFNNMLAVILGYSDNLADSPNLVADERDAVSEIRVAAQRAAALTRQLLAFSRKEVLEPRVLNLNSVVTEMEKLLRRLIGEDVVLKTALFPALWPVKVDPGQMEQVIMNLAVNARDAMPQGGMLTLSTSNFELREGVTPPIPELMPGHYVRLWASDTGQGIDPSVLDRIFDPFFTTKEPGKGTGLGLSFVYGIIQQSNGHVAVASELGRGTAFTIYLPSIGGTLHGTEENQPSPARNVGAETVLLVEDEETVRKLLRLALTARGYTVLEAKNGMEALEIFQSVGDKIHIVVTDVVMPLMNGRALSEKLRLIQPNVKVLYISGYTDDAIVRQGVQEAEVHFLRKPFLPSDLATKVREVLDFREGTSS